MMENKADEKKIETREDVNDANGTSDANEANKANRPYEADGTVTAAVSPARLSMGPAEWLLSLAIPVGAYLYISLLGWPTLLGKWLWEGSYLSLFLRLGFGWLIFTGIFVSCGLLYLRASKKMPARESWAYLILVAAVALWVPLCLYEDQNVFIFMLIFLHGAAVYCLLTAAGNRSDSYLNERGIRDLGRGFISLPFSGWLLCFRSWGSLLVWGVRGGREDKGRGRQVFFGLLICLPVFLCVLVILMMADEYFYLFIETAFSGLIDLFQQWNFMSMIFTLMLLIPVTCYLYSLVYNAVHKEAPQPGIRRQAPPTMLVSFLIPLLVLYLVFFAVRLAGVSGAMEDIASGEIYVSTYAREGFFELCIVAAINLCVFGLVSWFSPQAGTGLRLMLSGLCAETLAFIVLAFSKMWYYISVYGSFTLKRALCCWLLLTLFVLFILMTVQLWRRFKGVRIGIWFGCVTFLLLAYSNLPAWAP